MKNKTIKYIFLILLGIIFCSCSDSTEPTSMITVTITNNTGEVLLIQKTVIIVPITIATIGNSSKCITIDSGNSLSAKGEESEHYYGSYTFNFDEETWNVN